MCVFPSRIRTHHREPGPVLFHKRKIDYQIVTKESRSFRRGISFPPPAAAGLRQEIFELLFDAANIATFAPEDKIKYEYAMTTERDIRNQIRYAEKKGMEKEAEQIARRVLEMSLSKDVIQQATGLTEEQIKAL